mmetsp:Transcript_41468/g.67301  ORF Transcript_41468/g.67301 Transcript_41468/m.67301 type:complete len:93 (+) Transcript_41468:158-436(+)
MVPAIASLRERDEMLLIFHETTQQWSPFECSILPSVKIVSTSNKASVDPALSWLSSLFAGLHQTSQSLSVDSKKKDQSQQSPPPSRRCSMSR